MFKKFIGPFLLFCLFLILPCVCITYYANHLITRKIITNDNNFLNSAAANLDTAFSSASSQAMTLMQKNSADFYTLLNPSDSSKADMQLASYRLYSSLQQFDFYSDYFSEYFIYFKNSDMIFTSEGTFDSDTFFQDSPAFNSYLTQLMSKNYKNSICPLAAASASDGSKTKNVVSSRRLSFAVNPSGYHASDAVFVFLFDETKLNEILDSLNTAKSCYLYLFDMTSGQILNQPDHEAYASRLSLETLKYPASEGERYVATDGDFRLFWKKSSVSPLLYLCVEPQLFITRQLQSFLLLTLLTVFFSLAVVIALYFFFTRRIQIALSDIFLRLHQIMGNPFPSGETDENLNLNSLKSAVELLCKTQEEDKPALINSFFGQLLQNSLTPEEIDSFCRRFHLFPVNCIFCISIVKTEEPPLTSFLSRRTFYSSYLIPFQDPCICIFLVFAENADSLEKNLRAVCQQISEESFSCDFKCTCSSFFQELWKAPEHYRRAMELLESHGVRENRSFYTAKDLSHTFLILLPEHKKRLSLLLQTPEDALCPYVEQLLQDFCAKNITFSSYRSVILEILFMVQENLYDEAILFSSVFSMEEKELLPAVEKILIPDHLKAFCMDICQSYASEKASAARAKSSAEDMLLSYINEHLSEINLTLLSEATGMNPNYLSQYFKKHFGITFLEYINRQKIGRAKELLTTTSMTCKAIGESLGYSNQNVFIRSFKKLEAVTPNEYRRSHQDIPR